MSTIPQILKDCRTALDKAMESTRREFAGIRSGKASPNMLDTIRVEVYGSQLAMNQVATVSVPEPRVLIVTPFDKGQIKAIEKAIRESDLGLNPANDGHVVRLAFPALTEERRKELVRLVRHMAEEGKVALRNLRRSARHELESLERAGDLREDDLKRAEKELDDMIHAHESTLGGALADKEKELLDE
jgi:ribosome recycling factor